MNTGNCIKGLKKDIPFVRVAFCLKRTEDFEMKKIKIEYIRIITILLLLLGGYSNCFPQTIAIDRVYYSDFAIGGCTIGYLSIDGEVICYTLELPYRNNESNISSIPSGSYYGHIRTDGNRGWRIELEHVAYRKYIQVHVGNYTSETSGCTLVGMQANIDYCTVWHSQDAMNNLRQKVEPLLGHRIRINYYN
ncbi:MAG: DUF5675 family protein [Cyanobacteria bacterium J06649_11]